MAQSAKLGDFLQQHRGAWPRERKAGAGLGQGQSWMGMLMARRAKGPGANVGKAALQGTGQLPTEQSEDSGWREAAGNPAE